MNIVIESIDFTLAINNVRDYLRGLQERVCQMIVAEEGQQQFREDPWQHVEGGGGLTRVMEGGQVIEKVGVNFSEVRGVQLPPAATRRHLHLQSAGFHALGVSIVIHPVNPYAPTAHANVRFIVLEEQNKPVHWWFGGGFDLTPYYGFQEDCEHWHRTTKMACDPFGKDVYPAFKKWCDDYFYLKHRQEPRGIGGIFYDDLNNLKDPRWTFDKSFAFMQTVGDHFIKAYQPILAKRKKLPFTAQEREFQTYRRGRYVEFNLLYDRGTLFGLQSGGRTESILMSLPPQVSWRYDWAPQTGSKEAELYEVFLKEREWV